MKLSILVGILIFTLAPERAKCEEKPVPPPGPLIQRVPAYIDWCATIRYLGENKADSAAPKTGKSATSVKTCQERMIKTKDISYYSWVDEMGGKEECWSIKGMQWITPKGVRQREFAMNPQAPYFKEDLPISTFPGFEWLSASNFMGIQKFMEKECMVFQSAAAPDKRMIAYIDADTRLPLLLKTSEMVRLYSFGAPPLKMLAIPDDIAKFLQIESEHTAKIMAPGAR